MSKKYEAVIILDDQIHEDGGTVFIEAFTNAVDELGGALALSSGQTAAVG